MPDSPLRKASPPPSGRARATGKVDPVDVEPRVESTEPDDDLSDYLIPEDPEPVAAPVDVAPVVSEAPAGPRQVTSADTELVRKLEAELAVARARLDGRDSDVSQWAAGPAPVDPQPGEKILIHVREDGFTAVGRVWYRGQELEFTVGQANWKATCNIHGKSWLVMSDADQIRAYGQIMFGHGPWPGLPFNESAAVEAERRRGRTAPSIPQLSAVQRQSRS